MTTSDSEAANSLDVFRVVMTGAALVVIVAGMKAATNIIVPFLLATFLAILAGPPLAWLAKRGFSRGMAVLVIVGMLAIFCFFAVNFLSSTVSQLVSDWTEVYQPRSIQLVEDWNHRLESRAETSPWVRSLQLNLDDEETPGVMDPDRLLSYFTNAMISLTGTLSNVLFILLTTLFILFEAVALPKKIRMAFPHPETATHSMERVAKEVNRYMGIKTWTSLLTGVTIGLSLTALGVNYAILLGTLAFVLNFVPNIGSILAAVPAVLLALIDRGLTVALIACVIYIAVNMLIGNYLEPKWMGQGLGLSTLCVFVSLVFWGWVLGPVGMVISVPLTMALKIALEAHQETRGIAILMGNSTEPTS